MSDGLVFLIESRGAAALVYGLAVGALLRLLGLARNRGAAAGAVVVTATFVPVGWPAAHLGAVVLGLCGLAGRLGRAGGIRPGAFDVAVIGGAYAIASWGVALSEIDGLWQAAAVASLGIGAAAWLVRAFPPAPGGARYRLPSITPRADGEGIGAPALAGAAAVPLGVAALAYLLGLLGPAEPGSTALGALLGLAVLGDGSSRARGLAATAIGGAAGAAATAFLA